MSIVIALNTVIVPFRLCSPHPLSVQIQASLVKFLLLQRSNATYYFPHTALMGTWFQTFLDLLVVHQRFAISGTGKILSQMCILVQYIFFCLCHKNKCCFKHLKKHAVLFFYQRTEMWEGSWIWCQNAHPSFQCFHWP